MAGTSFCANNLPSDSFDCGLATEAMSIAALSLGYGTKIIASPSIALNGEKKADFDKLLQIPKGYSNIAVLLIGHNDESLDATTSASTRSTMEIFLTLRIKEEHDQGISNEESVARGLERTASTVTSAALIMVIVFGSFILASSILTQQIGLGLAVAIFLDASVIRIILMPATMRLLGEWNWWFPKFLDKFLPRINIKE